MPLIKTGLVAASLVVAASAANAQNRDAVTTYVGGPKSGLTQTILRSYAQALPAQVGRPRVYSAGAVSSGGANAIGVDDTSSAYAQVPVRQRSDAAPGRTVSSGGANAIGADEAGSTYTQVPVRQRSGTARSRTVPSGGANAIGADEAR